MSKPTDYSKVISDHQARVALVNAFYDGVDSAKSHIIQYVNESDDGYKQRLEMARLSNYTAQAIDSIAQIVMRKPTNTEEIKAPLLDYLNTIDYQNTFDRFATDLLYATAKDGFTFVLVDKDSKEEASTKADTDKLRPYAVHIPRGRVRSFKEDTQGNITSFVYDESYTVDTGFVDEILVQQRAFVMKEDGVYSQVWREDELFSEAVSDLDYIPIVKLMDDEQPRFYNLAVMNKNHLNLKSENRDNLRKLIIIPVIWDGSNSNTKLQVSTTTGIKFTGSPSECDFQYRSPDGTFLASQEKAITEEEVAMRMEIAEIFEGSSEKTATEVELMNTRNDAVMTLFATIIEDGLNAVLSIMADYQNATFTEGVKVNRDYLSNKLTEGQIAQIRNDYVAGAITHEFYLKTMVQGEVYLLSDEEIMEQVEKAVI